MADMGRREMGLCSRCKWWRRSIRRERIEKRRDERGQEREEEREESIKDASYLRSQTVRRQI
jgi:hypothetical protein